MPKRKQTVKGEVIITLARAVVDEFLTVLNDDETITTRQIRQSVARHMAFDDTSNDIQRQVIQAVWYSLAKDHCRTIVELDSAS